MKINIMVATAALLFAAGAACAMDAETFYVKGTALKNKGMAAMFSSDIKPMTAEMKSAAAAVKAENEKAKAAGRPLYCPPAKAKMSAQQLLAEFGKIPQARRKALTVRQAWREILISKYPC